MEAQEMETLEVKIRRQSIPEIPGQVLTEEETVRPTTVRCRGMVKHEHYKWFVRDQIQMEVYVEYMNHQLLAELMIREE